MQDELKFNNSTLAVRISIFSVRTEFIYRNILNSFIYVYKFEDIFMKQKKKKNVTLNHGV